MARPLDADDRRRTTEDGPFGPADTNALAALMLDAYRGTVDDEGEDLEDAVGAIEALFGGDFGELDFAASVVFRVEREPVAATFVTQYEGRPLIAFSMTRPGAARRGFARRGLHHAFGVLARAGETEVHLVVTDGNDPAAGLYLAEGFSAVDAPAGS